MILRHDLRYPGSKSILQRLMVVLAHARGDICIRNYNPCNDVLELEHALQMFGFTTSGKGNVRCFHFSKDRFYQSSHHYHFEASATAFRLWISVLANLPGIRSQVFAQKSSSKGALSLFARSSV
jgi:5-enolpyruvylshikimate-3-phosphate synthase